MADGVNHNAQEAPRHRRRRTVVDHGAQGPALPVPTPKKSKDLAGSDIDIQRAKKKIAAHDAFTVKNSSVDPRAHKDKLELKAVKDGSASYAALEKKTALYAKLARGEPPDEEDKEKYCVDFFVKRHEQDDSEQFRQHESSVVAPPENQDGEGEVDVSMLFNQTPMGLRQAGATWDNDEHKRFVREVHLEANQAREKASELKVRRKKQAIARCEKLKQAYIWKQVKKLKAGASNSAQT